MYILCIYISVHHLQEVGATGEAPEVAEAAPKPADSLPDTIPETLDNFQDAQTPPDEPMAGDEVADTLPDAPEPADVQEKPNAKSIPAEKDVPGDDGSIASTASLGEPWEKELY